MKLFSSTPQTLSTDEFKRALESLEAEARQGLAETREMHRLLLLARAGIGSLER